MRNLVLVSLIVIGSLGSAFAKNTNTEKLNKKVVKSFYDLAFNKHKPAEAMSKYVGKEYKQHNPFAGDGKKPFIEFFSEYYKKHTKAKVEIKRMLADEDLVMVHVHSKQKPQDRGNAVVDIFRVKNGKIVEHWDVMQNIPEKAANDNSMF
jgi:predicted SnoaL-like aldol condensation-catalyzing enzyme